MAIPNAPYRKEHFFATSLERLFSAELDVDWQEYERFVDALGRLRGLAQCRMPFTAPGAVLLFQFLRTKKSLTANLVNCTIWPERF